MLIYRGNSTVISFAADSEFAEMFVPSVVSMNAALAKNAAARLSHSLMSVSGSQSTFPYSTDPAEVTIMPMKAASVNATGMMASCTYCLHMALNEPAARALQRSETLTLVRSWHISARASVLNVCTGDRERGGAYCEVRNVHGECCVEAEGAVERAEPRPGEGRAVQMRVVCEEPLRSGDFDNGPYEHREPCRGHYERFDKEQPSNPLRRDKHERELE